MCGRGVCVAGGHAWWVYMVGGHAWWGGVCMMPWQILRDTVNERAVRVLLECILVNDTFQLESICTIF